MELLGKPCSGASPGQVRAEALVEARHSAGIQVVVVVVRDDHEVQARQLGVADVQGVGRDAPGA
jgi:glycerophosphoryl diester phosphodiesterase